MVLYLFYLFNNVLFINNKEINIVTKLEQKANLSIKIFLSASPNKRKLKIRLKKYVQIKIKQNKEALLKDIG